MSSLPLIAATVSMLACICSCHCCVPEIKRGCLCAIGDNLAKMMRTFGLA